MLLNCKEIQPVHPKGNQSWIFIGRTNAEAETNTLATWWEELTHWKRPWCWERLETGGEGDDRGWDGWMASLTQWTWVWASSGSWWWTGGKPGMLQSMRSQRVRHDWATELNWNPDFRIKRCILKSRDVTLLTKVRLLKAMVFLVIMYGCECWTIKNVGP